MISYLGDNIPLPSELTDREEVRDVGMYIQYVMAEYVEPGGTEGYKTETP